MSREEVLGAHPGIDRSALERSLELGEQLRAAGLPRARYSLATPLSGRRSLHPPAGKDAVHAHATRRPEIAESP